MNNPIEQNIMNIKNLCKYIKFQNKKNNNKKENEYYSEQ